jgi:hypothetical protein
MFILATDWGEAFGTAAINFGFVAVLGGLAGLLLGSARRRRELDYAAYEAFCATYGRFFSAWKSWETLKDLHGGLTEIDPDKRADLAVEVASLEGELEAVFVRLTGLRRLTPEEQERFGRLRDGFQRLREAIEDKLPRSLPWAVDETKKTKEGVRSYLTFKALAVELAECISRPSWAHVRTWRRPSVPEAQKALITITSWRAEGGKDDWATAKRNEDVINNVQGLLPKAQRPRNPSQDRS